MCAYNEEQGEEQGGSFVLWFEDINMDSGDQVGGKNASLGEMYSQLVPLGVAVPGGFAITAEAYRRFLAETGVDEHIRDILADLDTDNIHNLRQRGKQVRDAILQAEFPEEIKEEVRSAYQRLEEQYGEGVSCAVRSSATAEDLPGASFAGQQDTYLNVSGATDLLEASKKCIASLFTDRAISYREDKGFSHFDVALSVGVQKMVRSDKAASGVAFTIHTETGFENVAVINSSYGLGDMVVQGRVNPDEFLVFKPTLKEGYKPIIGKTMGDKRKKIIYSERGTTEVAVSEKEQHAFSISDEEVLQLAEWCVQIENHFSEHYGTYQPMDIEWAKDGESGRLFIVQARPETVHSSGEATVYEEYILQEEGDDVLAEGVAVGNRVATGETNVIEDAANIDRFKEGQVLITDFTDPDWEPIMKIASAIVTNKGGRTSHAAIVSRELGIPCVVGCGDATKHIKSGTAVTVDCSSSSTGRVYKGTLPYDVKKHELETVPETETSVMVNVGAPHEAMQKHYLPAKGVGLGRLEFIIASHIQVHPRALLNYGQLKSRAAGDREVRRIVSQIDELTEGYEDKQRYYIEQLTTGIAQIAATFWPHEILIRFSDFKTNEYRKLVGGQLYEPKEENPMLGWRGASRYYSEDYAEAFGLECRAIKRAREKMGLTNIMPLIPFCRTVDEGLQVLTAMEENGLVRGANEMKVYLMCEIPSNVVLADEFLEHFDGMSIGSNDLTQLTLGIDRDSAIVADVGDENNPAVKRQISHAIEACNKAGKYIGICGDAPSTFPEFTRFLVEEGIQSVSVSPDVMIQTLEQVAEWEQQRNTTDN